MNYPRSTGSSAATLSTSEGRANSTIYCALWEKAAKLIRLNLSQVHRGIWMARPYWSGQIRISLVSFGVNLYTATETKDKIAFHQISRSTGERVRHQKVLNSSIESGSDEPGTVLQKDEIVKGYEYSKRQYVIIEPSEPD